MDTDGHDWTLRMDRRVRFEGQLRMNSALHVGSGSEASHADATVLRHADGRPFIPGSSLKGALRSHLERLSQSPALADVGVESCLLYPDHPQETTAPNCPTPGWVDAGKDATSAEEEQFEALCHTCTLFGSPILAGKVRIPDLDVVERSFGGEGEVRDGVGIDRDRGQAVDGVKFDYEVVPSDTAFHFSIAVENPDVVELGLLAAGVRELQRGNLPLGGKTTRGLGACTLEDLSLYDADLSSASGLSDYLTSRGDEKATEVDDPASFLDDCIEALLTGEEG
jgi:CRISPR-associated RAMP protein (TIGR02581 family)